MHPAKVVEQTLTSSVSPHTFASSMNWRMPQAPRDKLIVTVGQQARLSEQAALLRPPPRPTQAPQLEADERPRRPGFVAASRRAAPLRRA